ncbi:hypothetical protein MMC12_004203 [Toensbergia leucococca]|nr:hypothetical protein [Toensbergia leucococca]
MSCVHRDLKLENILLDKNENVKLCDFGFTREYEGKASYLQTFCGTVCYSAPEMLKGEKYAGEKVDVWSLGIILFALLTGELPFDEDDDLATKHKILKSEPKYPETLPSDARALIDQLLSKRPLHRPTIADILTNPFLAGHAPQQQAILKLTQPAPFTTRLEKETLERMRSAGVDIDKVIENVLAQRCDCLAGWWALLIEKEERKEKRRERKRKEREAEAKNLRRLSAVSMRLDNAASSLKEIDEERLSPLLADAPRSRGRRDRRSLPSPQIVVPELPRLPEGTAVESPRSATPPPPIEKDSIRSASSSRQRPPLPPKERRRSRGSTLQLVASNPDLFAPAHGFSKRRSVRRHNHTFMNQLASIKHWFIESAKRARSPGSKSDASTLKPPQEKSPVESRRSPTNTVPHRGSGITILPSQNPRSSLTPRPRISTPNHRPSLSPAPLTPHSYRRSSAGLRGRKSTSSSISSIRSIHHVHSHSKASSTSSTSNSVNSSAVNVRPIRSPHSSVKVLPATPIISTFPSNIRVVRAAPAPINTIYNESATFGTMASPSLIFARRKKTPFRGPNLTVGTGGSPAGRGRERSASAAGRRSAEIIQPVQEEDEDEVEEVEAFSPVAAEVEETIWEGGEGVKKGWFDYTVQ